MSEAVATPSAPATPAASTPASAAPTGQASSAAAQPAGGAQAAPPAASSPPAGAPGASAKPGEVPRPLTPGADAAKQASAPPQAEARPTEPAKDEVAETMARLNKEAREVAKAKKQFEQSQKELGDKVKLAEAMTRAREALGKKDFLGALTALAGESGLDPDEAAVLLLEQANSREKPPLTEKDIERIAEEKFKAKEEAERKAAEERGNAELDQGKQLYGNACAQVYKADPSKFPLISTYGLDDAQMFEWVLPEAKRNRGEVPTPQKTLEHFEAQHLAKFEKAAAALGYVKASVAQAAPAAPAVPGKADPAKVPVTAPAVNTEGVVEDKPKQKRESIADYNRRIREQFRARRGQAA